MKHEATIKLLLATMHEDWMDDADKAELENMIMSRFGDELSNSIDERIANGYSVETQVELFKLYVPLFMARGMRQ